jgi:hypothetical protein
MANEVAVALIGVASAAFVAWATAKLTWRLELQKWRRARDDLHTGDLRAGLQQLILTISAATHSMCWLTWLASADPTKLTQERVNKYDAEMHRLLPKLLGYHALVASLRPQTYRRFDALIGSIFKADRDIGNASLKFIEGQSASAAALAALHPTSMKLESQIPQTVRAVLADITRADDAKFFA